ncbi:hypothetical protein F4805DRAFT_438452 [Annulohypoxylon moriforme]|nr:hypothetical protein F4805DRAFT_438452 [Annulohypoxylon moriforme]
MDDIVFAHKSGVMFSEDDVSLSFTSLFFTHRSPHQTWGPCWSGPGSEVGISFQTLVDIHLHDLGTGLRLNESNTHLVLLPDLRVAYIPLWASFQVFTFPNHEQYVTGQVNYGILTPAPEEDGTWVIFPHGLCWLPVDEFGATIKLMGRSDNQLMQVLRDGNSCLTYDPESANQFPNFSLISLDIPSDMYITTEFLGVTNTIKIPETQFVVVIQSSVQPLNNPPFEQWNILRIVTQASAGGANVSPNRDIAELARAVGSITRE